MIGPSELTRRKLLAAIGAGGLAAGAGLVGASYSGSRPGYTHYTLAQTNGPLVRVAWYSLYNGALFSGSPTTNDEWDFNETDEYVDDVATNLSSSGPVIDVPNLLPGDHGTLSIGLLAEERAEVWMRLNVSGSSGKLDEAVNASVWYDTGIFGIGGCDGSEDAIGASPFAEGTLAELGKVDSLAKGVLLDPGWTDNSCMAVEDRLCLGFSWSVPTSVGNEVQNDSVSFDLEFVALRCENEVDNPFDVVNGDD